MLDLSILAPGAGGHHRLLPDLPVEGAALLVGHPNRLNPALVLQRRSIGGALEKWVQACGPGMPLLRRARRAGFSEPLSNDDDPTTRTLLGPGGGLVMLPASYSDRRWWVLVLKASRQRLGEGQLRLAELWLRDFHGRFESGPEQHVGRGLVTTQGKTLHRNTPLAAALIGELPRDPVAEVIRDWVPLRWDHANDTQPLDITIRVADRPVWLRLWAMHTELNPAEHGKTDPDYWFVEYRESRDHPLPTVALDVDSRVHRALGLIDRDYRLAPDLTRIAEHVGTSPYHFHRLFTQVVGLSPKAYLQQKQMQIACWLLQTTRQPIRDVAHHVGYSNHGHFTSTFQRVIGNSPSHYRESS